MDSETLLRAAAGASAPWNSIYASRESDARVKLPGDFRQDSQREIDRCLHCPFDDCDGEDCSVAWRKILVVCQVKKVPGKKSRNKKRD